MSNIVHIFVNGSDFEAVEKRGYFNTELCFELSKWNNMNLLGIVNAEKIPFKYYAYLKDHKSLGGSDGRYGFDYLNEDAYLIKAKTLKGVPLLEHNMGWKYHPTRLAWHKAIEAFINELPDDWPLIITRR